MGAVSKKKVGECPLDSAVVRGRSETRRARRVCVEGRKVAEGWEPFKKSSGRAGGGCSRCVAQATWRGGGAGFCL